MENLPEEIKIKIFRRLDCKSLKEAASVCKDWRNTILTSRELMKTMKFHFYSVPLQINFLRTYGAALSNFTVGQLHYTFVINMSYRDLSDALQTVNNVELLTFRNVELSKRLRRVPTFNFHLLNKVIFNGYVQDQGGQILKMLKHCTPKECEVTAHSELFSEGYQRWVQSQQKLETLTLDFSTIVEFLRTLNFDQPLVKLKKLNLDIYLGHLDSDCIKNSKKYFKQQDQLEEIRLKVSDWNSSLNNIRREQSFNEVLFQVENLKKIWMRNDLHLEYCRYDFNVTNKSVEELDLMFSDPGTMPQYIQCFPHLKSLKIKLIGYKRDFLKSSVLKDIQTSLLHLRKLKLATTTMKLDETPIKFQNLLKLTFIRCKLDPANWKLLVDRLPFIEKLVLDLFKLTDESAEPIANWTNLREIAFQCGYYETGLIEIVKKCPKLKKLEVSKSMKADFESELENSQIETKISRKSVITKYTPFYDLRRTFKNNRADYFDFEICTEV